MASDSWNNMEFEGVVVLGGSDEEMDGSDLDLMSLLEDASATQGEDAQDEKLGSVIRSLEAEIDKINSNNDRSGAHQSGWNRDEDCNELNEEDIRLLESMSGDDTYNHEFYCFDWPVDADMAGYTSYSNMMELWGASPDLINGNEIIVGMGVDYSQLYFGEEEQQEHHQLYCSLWQETYDY